MHFCEMSNDWFNVGMGTAVYEISRIKYWPSSFELLPATGVIFVIRSVFWVNQGLFVKILHEKSAYVHARTSLLSLNFIVIMNILNYKDQIQNGTCADIDILTIPIYPT
jgi:hypothetical protein